MDIQKGYCRLTMKNGLISFGEILDIKEKYIDFLEVAPSAISKRISINDIADFDQYAEDDIPAYE